MAACAGRRTWLFPGDRAGQPITRAPCGQACEQAHDRAPAFAKPVTPHSLAPRLRRPSAGSRHRRAHHSTAARPSRSGDHRPLPADRHQQGLRAPRARSICCRVRSPPLRHPPAAVLLSGGAMAARARSGGHLPPLRRSLSSSSMAAAVDRPAPRHDGDRVCRTAALGGHVEQCDHCGHQRIAFNSCRNRHCPKCQSLARAQWIEDRRAELLDRAVLPRRLHGARRRSPPSPTRTRRWSTASSSAPPPRPCAPSPPIPKHLGAEIGFFAVLHTWGQTPASSSAPALRRPRRRPVARRHALDRLPARVLPAGAGPLPPLPPPVPGAPRESLRRRQAAVLGALAALSDPTPSPRYLAPCARPSGSSTPSRPSPDRTGARLRRPLHPPRRHLQQSPARHRATATFASAGRTIGRLVAEMKTMTLAATEFIRRFFSTSCPRASTASATTAFSATATAPRSSPAAGNSSR